MSITKRYFTMPHHHKDTSQPMYLANGELHPLEDQPANVPVGKDYRKHLR